MDIFEAARKGDINEVKAYIEHGGNVNVKDSEGFTPLFYAADFNKTEVMKLLVNAGADHFGHSALIECLKNAGIEIPLRETRFPDLSKEVKPQDIPLITDGFLAIKMNRDMGDDLGKGKDTYMKGIDAWNKRNFSKAEEYYNKALQEGLAITAQAAARNKIGQCMLDRNNLSGAIQQFLLFFQLKEATYSSVNDVAEFLSVILDEIGRSEEAGKLKQLARLADGTCCLSTEIKNKVRQLVRKYPLSSQTSISSQGWSQTDRQTSNNCTGE